MKTAILALAAVALTTLGCAVAFGFEWLFLYILYRKVVFLRV